MVHTRRAKKRSQDTGRELRMLANQHIFHHRHVIKQTDLLERAGDTTPEYAVGGQADKRCPIQANIPHGGAIDASNQIENSGFPRAVGSDNTNNLTRPDLQVHILHRCQSAKMRGNILQVQQGLARMFTLLYDTHSSSLSCSTLFYANFSFKAWISCCDIQRTQLQCGLLFWSAGQFTPPTRAWDETCRPEDHNHNENDPEDQVTNIAEGKTRNNVYDKLVKAMQEVRRVRSQRVQRVQDKQVDRIDGKRAHNHARDAAYTADDNHG